MEPFGWAWEGYVMPLCNNNLSLPREDFVPFFDPQKVMSESVPIQTFVEGPCQWGTKLVQHRAVSETTLPSQQENTCAFFCRNSMHIHIRQKF